MINHHLILESENRDSLLDWLILFVLWEGRAARKVYTMGHVTFKLFRIDLHITFFPAFTRIDNR